MLSATAGTAWVFDAFFQSEHQRVYQSCRLAADAAGLHLAHWVALEYEMYVHGTAEMTICAVLLLQAVRQYVQLHGRSQSPLRRGKLRSQLERWLHDFKRAGIQHNVESLTSVVQVSMHAAAWPSRQRCSLHAADLRLHFSIALGIMGLQAGCSLVPAEDCRASPLQDSCCQVPEADQGLDPVHTCYAAACRLWAC